MSYEPKPSRVINLRRAIAATIMLGAASMHSQYVLGQEEEEGDVTQLSDIQVTDGGLRALSNEPSAASFGFSKPLLETPRSVTFVSEEQLRLFGVSSVEDLTRLVPGTYTTTRYGLQGGISVRGVSADFYYRGMKRLQMQGHVRTVLSAYDNIEVIKGPPSPIFGLGKIGGYANLDPKSNRAKTGMYMPDVTGYVQSTVGRYNKNEMQFGTGIPFTAGGRPGGVYIVALLENSDTFVDTVSAEQKFVQATLSLDNVIGNFRMETGGQLQNSVTAGAYFTRVTPEFINDGLYIQGTPMVNLDLNGDGRVGIVEKFLGSPPVGNPSGSNQALDQRFALPQDANGNPIPIGEFANTINGIPQFMKDYLVSGQGAALDCPMANYMRDTAPVMAVGEGIVTREMPVGFALNPCDVDRVALERPGYRRNGAYEREQNATQRMFYFDLINDINPDFTIKNQFFYDSIDSFKDSWLPYGEDQKIYMLEDKVTVTRRIPDNALPGWLTVDSLASLNFRKSVGYIKSSGGDYDYRMDITRDWGAAGSGVGGFGPNEMFWTALTYPDYQNGAVLDRDRESEYTETGFGVMFDVSMAEDTNIILGARYDRVAAKAIDDHRFVESAGDPINTEENPITEEFIQDYINGNVCMSPTEPNCIGNPRAGGSWADSSDGGVSWSISVSHQLPWGKMRPYATLAETTILLDSSNNMYTQSQVDNGDLIGTADLVELGIKGELLDGRMQWAAAYFDQERSDIQGGADPTINAFVSSTTTKGIEASVNFQATDKWFIGASFVNAQSRYLAGADNLSIDVSARDLGFQDIQLGDSTYYAEAFGYGGRTRIFLTDPNNIYDEVPGTPELQASLNTTYQLGRGFGLLGNIQHVSEQWASRLQTFEIPSSTMFNIGATWDSDRVHLKANIYNLTDEITFRPTSGGNSNMVSVMPDRRWELSLKIDF